ncbi:MAG: FMN-binding glutamate synthase family protein, partial [Paracoccaceae bacterium]
MGRFSILVVMAALAVFSAFGMIYSFWLIIPLLIFAALAVLGVYDIFQPSHAILRNYPILGHMRFLFEGIRPEIRQYLIESDQDEEPFSRDDRSLVYQRAKGVEDKRPFGTRQRVYDAGFTGLTHSIQPLHIA